MEDKILKLFRRHPDAFLSGEDISERLDISRSAVWKHIEKLRSMGYEFNAVPHLGYRLAEIPDRLYPDEIGYGLKTDIIAKEMRYYDIIDSTNTLAYNLAKKGEEEGLIVIAEGQSRGRGRLSRQWLSPKYKGIYISLILRPKITPFQAPYMTLLSAVSAAQAIRESTGLAALIKWPNDIVLNGKKVAGILTEMDAEPDSVNFLILGIGINVNTNSGELPKDAGSISEEAKTKVSRLSLLKSLLERLEDNYKLFKREGFSPIATEWKNLSATLGRRVRAVCMHKKVEGEAIGIDSDGALIIRLDNGFQEKILAGDIAFLR